MKVLADMVISLADFLEAEGRQAKTTTINLTKYVILMAVAAALAITGAVLALYGLYRWIADLLDTRLSPGLVALTIGILALLGAGGLIWTAMKTAK